MIIKEIEYDSFEYKKSVILRDKILRAPLGLYFTDDYLEQDKNQIILAALEARTVLGVLHLTILNTDKIRMRQVAVKKNIQSKGIGTQLVTYSENIAKDRDFKRMELDARETSIPFYEKLGYRCIGNEFEALGIPHRKMFKNL